MIRKNFIFVAAFIAGIATVSGCQATSHEALVEALDNYVRGVRWRNDELMARHIPNEDRNEFDERSAALSEIRISHCELAQLVFLSKDRAKAIIRVDWYSLRDGSIRSSIIEQTWERKNKEWLIVEQQKTRGAPMPLFPTMTSTPGSS